MRARDRKHAQGVATDNTRCQTPGLVKFDHVRLVIVSHLSK